jgi:hypothetical protein
VHDNHWLLFGCSGHGHPFHEGPDKQLLCWLCFQRQFVQCIFPILCLTSSSLIPPLGTVCRPKFTHTFKRTFILINFTLCVEMILWAIHAQIVPSHGWKIRPLNYKDGNCMLYNPPWSLGSLCGETRWYAWRWILNGKERDKWRQMCWYQICNKAILWELASLRALYQFHGVDLWSKEISHLLSTINQTAAVAGNLEVKNVGFESLSWQGGKFCCSTPPINSRTHGHWWYWLRT